MGAGEMAVEMVVCAAGYIALEYAAQVDGGALGTGAWAFVFFSQKVDAVYCRQQHQPKSRRPRSAARSGDS